MDCRSQVRVTVALAPLTASAAPAGVADEFETMPPKQKWLKQK